MTDIEELKAIEEIRQVKARYFRGLDTADSELVRGILAKDCVLEYTGCCTDPKSGRDFFPAMNIVVRGSTAWSSSGLAAMGVVSVHHVHNDEISITGEATARAVWSTTDRLFMPAEAEFSVMTGYGYYFETYEKIAGSWKIKTLQIERLRVEGR